MGTEALIKELETLGRKAEFLTHPIRVLTANRSSLRGGLPKGCHLHASWELRLSLRGSYYVEIPESSFWLPRGQMLLIPPGCLHVGHRSCLNRQPSTMKCFFLTLDTDDEITVGVQSHLGNNSSTLSPEARDQLMSMALVHPYLLLERVAHLEDRAVAAGRHYAQSLIKVLLFSLAEVLRVKTPVVVNARDQIVSKALDYLKANYFLPELTLKDIATEVGYSPNYLVNLFQKHYRKSIRQTLIDIRLEKANGLLRTRRYSVKEVAHLTGWSNQLYFSKVFHKRFGQPPSQLSRRS